jgi:hypothetical protein
MILNRCCSSAPVSSRQASCSLRQLEASPSLPKPAQASSSSLLKLPRSSSKPPQVSSKHPQAPSSFLKLPQTSSSSLLKLPQATSLSLLKLLKPPRASFKQLSLAHPSLVKKLPCKPPQAPQSCLMLLQASSSLLAHKRVD